MTFSEIVNLAYNMIDEIDYDEQVEIIVKNAINEAYADLCKKDKRLNRAYIPIINGIATLPDDIISVEMCTPTLDSSDRIIGNSIVTNKEGILEILYSYSRDSLVEDDEEPDLHKDLHRALAMFACYRYFMYRKKIENAESFQNNYETLVFKYEQSNTANEVGTITYIDPMN